MATDPIEALDAGRLPGVRHPAAWLPPAALLVPTLFGAVRVSSPDAEGRSQREEGHS